MFLKRASNDALILASQLDNAVLPLNQVKKVLRRLELIEKRCLRLLKVGDAPAYLAAIDSNQVVPWLRQLAGSGTDRSVFMAAIAFLVKHVQHLETLSDANLRETGSPQSNLLVQLLARLQILYFGLHEFAQLEFPEAELQLSIRISTVPVLQSIFSLEMILDQVMQLEGVHLIADAEGRFIEVEINEEFCSDAPVVQQLLSQIDKVAQWLDIYAKSPNRDIKQVCKLKYRLRRFQELSELLRVALRLVLVAA